MKGARAWTSLGVSMACGAKIVGKPMRITAGALKGRPLLVPEGLQIRPTSDKVRQAVFNVLENRDFGQDFAIENARVLDLFAGSGALGIEALSRGASYAILIDQAALSRAALRGNVEAMGLTGRTKIWRRDACDLGRNLSEAFDLIFLDPPYRKNMLAPALASLHAGRWLQSNSILVAESARDENIPSTDNYALVDERLYGDTRIAFLQPSNPEKI